MYLQRVLHFLNLAQCSYLERWSIALLHFYLIDGVLCVILFLSPVAVVTDGSRPVWDDHNEGVNNWGGYNMILLLDVLYGSRKISAIFFPVTR